MKANVIVVGSLNYDVVLFQERLPKYGETFFANDIKMLCGGKGANQAIQCAKLGIKTTMIGSVGQDDFGNACLQNLQKYHVDTRLVKQTQKIHTGMGVVTNFSNNCLISTISKGANFELTVNDLELSESVLLSAFAVVLQLEIPIPVVEYVIEKAKEAKVKVILNGAPAVKLSEKVLRKIDYFIVNETEAAFYANQASVTKENAKAVVKQLQQRTQKTVIITLGAEGSVSYDGLRYYEQPAEKVPVADTTGAGDSFVGALTYGLFQDWELKDILPFATKASSLTVQGIGGQDAMPELKEILNSCE